MKNLAMLFAIAALTGFATEHQWDDATSNDVVWKNSAAGWVSKTVPDWTTVAAQGDTTDFASEPQFLQQIFGPLTANATASTIPGYLYQDSVSGNERHMLRLSRMFGFLKIRDLVDFDGIFGNARSTDANHGTQGDASGAGVDLLATADHTPVINTLDVSGRFALMNTTTANSSAEVKELFGYGVFDVKTGDPSREIVIDEAQSGNDTQVTVAPSSTLTVGGLEGVTPGVAGNPLIHLDASDPDSVVTCEDDAGKGLHYWYDVRGKNGYPYASAPQAGARPWTTVDPRTGKGLMDFGYCNGGSGVNDSAYLGHVGYMRLIKADKPDYPADNYLKPVIKEAFWVFRDNSASNQTCMILGKSDGANVFARPWTTSTFGQSGLFRNCRSTLPTTTGEIRVDGKRVQYNDTVDTWRRLRVVNVALNGEGEVDDIGMSKQYRSDEPGANLDQWWGGFKLAEVILYTNRLTAAERAGVNAYLAAKWQTPGAENDFDFGKVLLGKNAQLKVKSGTVRVEELAADKTQTEFVKKGAGDLVVDRYEGPAQVKVEGGTLTFADHVAAIDDSAPAPEMYFRFDADNLASLVLSNSTGSVVTNFVTRWNSSATNAAGTVVWAVPGSAVNWVGGVGTTFYSKAPFIDPAVTANGRRVISFGDYIAMNGDMTKWATVNNTAYMAIKRQDAAKATMPVGTTREIFVVMKKTNAGALPFGNSNYDLLSGSGYLFLKDYSPSVPYGAICTVDGKTVDWFTTTVPAGEFFVIGLRFSDPINPGQLSGDRSNFNHGGYLLAEEIAYTRVLSPSERRNTEAYLLKKWKNLPHPLATRTASIQRLTVSATADNVLASDTELDVGAYVSASDKPLVKSGKGDVRVGLLDSSASSLEVTGGSLTAGVAPVIAKAAFHLDASDLSTLVLSNDAAAAGRQLVCSWRDPVTGLEAVPTYADDMKTTWGTRPWSEFAAYPRYESYQVGGKTLPIVNFGGYSKSDAPTTTWSEWSAAMKFPEVSFKEAHIVFADVAKGDEGAAADSRQEFVGSSSHYRYSRGGDS